MAAELDHNTTEPHERHLELHKKQSQPTLNATIANIRQNNDSTDVIISSISNSIRSSAHTAMDDATCDAARKYYQRIVNDARSTYDQKKLQIYLDLVVGSKIALKTNPKKHNPSEFSLNYKIGTQSEHIKSIRGCALTVGRYKEADICTGYQDLTVSRIQCFILIIDASLIILDGWSYFGTKTVSVNGNKHNMSDSLPNERFVLRYNRNDTVHLRFGETTVDLIINPKPCIVCMDKSRSIRNECGHLVLCKRCYLDIISAQCNAVCPVCRAPLTAHVHKSNDVHAHDDDMIKSYRKPQSIQ